MVLQNPSSMMDTLTLTVAMTLGYSSLLMVSDNMVRERNGEGILSEIVDVDAMLESGSKSEAERNRGRMMKRSLGY